MAYVEVDGIREIFDVATGDLVKTVELEDEPESIGLDSADDVFNVEQPGGSSIDDQPCSSAKVKPMRRSSRRKSKESTEGIL